jgi:intein-encoded DNA endonuclease-like protein
MARAKIDINKEKLRSLYIDKNLTPAKIGKIFDCNSITIRNRLKEFKIPFKDPAFARTRSKRKDFDNNLQDKAYMIAFRIGDLNVYKPSTKSQTIVVRCHTTQVEQILIIKSLFKGFGRITTSLNNGHYHINCFLNNTFDFLLSKNTDAWQWLKNNDELIPHFIAGYVDAEGNYILNQNRARFKVDSYDVEILTFISNWLISKGMNNRFRRIYKMGDIWKGNFPLNKDLWRLNINDMVSLQKFIELTLSLTRHKKRKADMKICLKNIKDRQNKKYGPKDN